MPTFNVATTPLQVTQSITQSASIQNLGPGTIYLGPDSSTSALSFGALLSPGSSVNWPANTPVWVVSDTTARIGVMYGATGASVGTVDATVKGPLQISDILSPVSVQGGSELLFSGATTLSNPGTNLYELVIPALSPQGLKYSGMRLAIWIYDSSTPAVIAYQIQEQGMEGTGYTGTLALNVPGNGTAYNFFYPQYADITFPNNFPYSTRTIVLDIKLLNSSAMTQINIALYGVSSNPTVPTSDSSRHLISGYSTITGPVASGSYTVPASYEPYTLDFYLNGTVDSISLLEDVYLYADVGSTLVTASELNSLSGTNVHYYMTTRGSNYAGYIALTNLVGTLQVAMSKAPAPPNFSVLKYYPIGSIYLTVNPANPSTIFGGTWVAWGTGLVPVGVNVSDPAFNTVEKTGGEQTHLLTSAESGLPAHNHSQQPHNHIQNPHNHSAPWSNNVGGSANAFTLGTVSGLDALTGSTTAVNQTSTAVNVANAAADASTAHNNLQPYITAYMWKRTA